MPSRLHVWGNHPDFNVINRELEELGHLMIGRVGMADTYCIDAAGFLRVALEKTRQNSRYFLENPASD